MMTVKDMPTLGWTPTEEGSTRRRDLYLKMTGIHVAGGIRTHNSRKRVAVSASLKRRAATGIGS